MTGCSRCGGAVLKPGVTYGINPSAVCSCPSPLLPPEPISGTYDFPRPTTLFIGKLNLETQAGDAIPSDNSN